MDVDVNIHDINSLSYPVGVWKSDKEVIVSLDPAGMHNDRLACSRMLLWGLIFSQFYLLRRKWKVKKEFQEKIAYISVLKK